MTPGEWQPAAEPISALINHMHAWDVCNLQLNGQFQFQVLQTVEKALDFRTLQASTREDIVHNQIIHEVEKSGVLKAATAPHLPFQGKDNSSKLLSTK